jgi:hypothetical protein
VKSTRFPVISPRLVEILEEIQLPCRHHISTDAQFQLWEVMVRLTRALLEWDTSIDRQSVPVHHSIPIGGLEREFIALPSLLFLVRWLSASVVGLIAGHTTPRLGHFKCLRGVLVSPLVPLHCRRELHAIYTCDRVSKGTLNTDMIPLDNYHNTWSCRPLLP